MEGLELELDRTMAEAEAAVRQALATVGFGILTEIDVAATLAAKLGVVRPPLKILGACNPSLAHRALELDPSVALALPCNVVLEQAGAGRTKVEVADPRALLAVGGTASAELAQLGEQARSTLAAALSALAG